MGFGTVGIDINGLVERIDRLFVSAELGEGVAATVMVTVGTNPPGECQSLAANMARRGHLPNQRPRNSKNRETKHGSVSSSNAPAWIK